MALEPPPTHAMRISGFPPNFSMHCLRVSLPITAWKLRTCQPGVRSNAVVHGQRELWTLAGVTARARGERRAHHHRVGVGPSHGPQDVVSILNVCDPVPDSF